jgi:hypothetical protein
MVSIASHKGEETLAVKAKAADEALHQKVSADPRVQKLLSALPGATIIKIRPRHKAEMIADIKDDEGDLL